jgi:hypothetical protein
MLVTAPTWSRPAGRVFPRVARFSYGLKLLAVEQPLPITGVCPWLTRPGQISRFLLIERPHLPDQREERTRRPHGSRKTALRGARGSDDAKRPAGKCVRPGHGRL